MAALTNGNSNGLGTTGTNGDGGPDQTLQEANQASQDAASLINAANQTQVQGELEKQLNQPSGPSPETVTLPTELTLRVLSSPDFYVANKRSFWSPGVFIVDPGAHGILGGDDQKIPCFISPNVCGGKATDFFQVQTDDFEMSSTSIAGGRVIGTVPQLIERTGFTWWGPTYGKTPEGPFDFPIFNVVGVHQVTNATMIDDDGNIIPLTGTAFTGKGGGFFAYQLFEEGDFDRPVLAFGGTTFTPTTTQDQLRLFNLFTDPRQNIGIPFAAAETSPTNLAGATVQPLYLLEDTSDGGRSVWLQTSFLIKGEGTDQQTILVLALGEQNEDGPARGRSSRHVACPRLMDHTGDTPG